MASKSVKPISLVMAVLNGAETLESALESVFNQDYPKGKFELIVVDDGSRDKTPQILKRLQKKYTDEGNKFRIITHKENKGRIVARARLVKEAKYKRIMILDHQTELLPGTLLKAAAYPEKQSLIANIVMDKSRSLEDRVLYLLRKKLYAPYFGENFKRVKLTDSNFNKIAKGTGGFVTNKDQFLKYSSLLSQSKVENDDTKLLHNYLDGKSDLYKVPDIKLLYKNRTGLPALQHLFGRGPRFVSYYFKKGRLNSLLFNNKKLTAGIISILSLSVIFLALILINPLFALIGVFLLYLINSIVAFYIAENGLDLISVFVYVPVVTIVFAAGVLNGLYIHYLKELRNGK